MSKIALTAKNTSTHNLKNKMRSPTKIVLEKGEIIQKTDYKV